MSRLRSIRLKVNQYGKSKRESEASVAHWSARNQENMGGSMDGCGGVVKMCLIVVNLATFIGGAIALGVGVWVYEVRSFPSTLIANNMYIGSLVVVLAMGAALMLLSVLGCCGAAREVKCMLLTYYTVVFLIFVVMLVGGILQFIFREQALITMDRELHVAIPYYGVSPKHTLAWDDTQSNLECCGVSSYKDWHDNVPMSCCREVYPGKRLDCKSSQNPTTMYLDGCLHKTIELLRENGLYVGSVAIVVTIFMLLALIFSCALFSKIQ